MTGWNSVYKSHQGNIGLGQAIAYYTLHTIPIMIPLNDTQKYDIVIDKNGLKRVSIKTTQQIERNNCFKVELKNSGGSSGTCKTRNFDNTSCDILFIYTIAGDMYEIPAQEITAHSGITLTAEYDKYKLT